MDRAKINQNIETWLNDSHCPSILTLDKVEKERLTKELSDGIRKMLLGASESVEFLFNGDKEPDEQPEVVVVDDLFKEEK